MLEQVEAALQRHDHQTASSILAKLTKKQPDNNQVKLYNGKLQEATAQLEIAEKIYRQLLQADLVDPKICQAARQGIERIKAIQAAKIETARAVAQQDLIAISNSNNLQNDQTAGLLILEPVAPEAKTAMALKFAQIMKIEAYNARLLIPSRSSRVYRVGNMGEMSFYERQFQAAGIPAFALSIEQLDQPEVIQIKSIDAFSPKAKLTGIDGHGNEFRRSYDWPDVQGIVSGLLPIFEEITQTSASTTKTSVQYKSQVLDYVQVWDLHLPSKQVILRLCSQNYVFQQAGEKIDKLSTSRENWQKLLDRVQAQIAQFSHQAPHQIPHWKEFAPFAETALGYPDLLEKIPAHLQLVRRQPSLWDQAFQLYSGTIFSRHQLSRAKNQAELN
jgi:hypothetical protein